MNFNQAEFGQRVKTLRKENGLTLQQMADELNISSFFDVSTDYRSDEKCKREILLIR